MEIKLTQEEIDSLTQIRKRTDILVTESGELALQKLKLEIIQESMKEELKTLLEEEQKLSNDLVSKYGPISIDLQKGIATKIT